MESNIGFAGVGVGVVGVFGLQVEEKDEQQQQQQQHEHKDKDKEIQKEIWDVLNIRKTSTGAVRLPPIHYIQMTQISVKKAKEETREFKEKEAQKEKDAQKEKEKDNLGFATLTQTSSSSNLSVGSSMNHQLSVNGILKSNWISKHFTLEPSVVLFFTLFDPYTSEWKNQDALTINEILDRKKSLVEKGVKLIVVFIPSESKHTCK